MKNERLKILLIEKDAATAQVIRQALERARNPAFEVEWSRDLHFLDKRLRDGRTLRRAIVCAVERKRPERFQEEFVQNAYHDGPLELDQRRLAEIAARNVNSLIERRDDEPDDGIIGAITDDGELERLLRHVGVESDFPKTRPARAPPADD